MPDKQKFERAICKFRRRLNRVGEAAKTVRDEVDGVQRDLEDLLDRFDPKWANPDRLEPRPIAIANGKVVQEDQFKDLDEDDYDIVLDCIPRSLLTKSQPGKRRKLKARSLEGIGARRMSLLRFMLEHLHWRICHETTWRVYGNDYLGSASALAKTISVFRNRLGYPSYIVNDHWAPESGTGRAYKMNNKYRYLIIRYEFRRS